MDEWKRRKTQRCNSDDDNERRCNSEHIPEELVMEILSRLPAKSIVRCGLVSKLWSSITKTPNFMKAFSSIRSTQPCALLTLRKDSKRFVFSAPVQIQNNNNNYKVKESYEFTIPNNDWLRRCESVQGLVYLETPKQIMIWNPIMKRIFTLPTLEGHYWTGFLGYEPTEGKYKVMCLLRKEAQKIGILTLGEGEQSSSSSWRILSIGFPGFNYASGTGVCIKGVIYFEARHMKRSIVSFDLRSEKFGFIIFPRMMRKSCDLWVSYQGRLALVENSSVSTTSVNLWILQEEEWIYKHFPSPPVFKERLFNESKWTFKGITDSGFFIYSAYKFAFEPNSFRRSLNQTLNIMYVDPKNNTWRKAKCGGIGVQDIHRLDEFSFDLINDFTVIPNHIDTLFTPLYQ